MSRPKVGAQGAVRSGGPHSRREYRVLGYLDLRSGDGRPSHSKLVALASWIFGLLWFCYFALHGASDMLLLGWGSLTFVAPYGVKGLSAWLSRP